MPPQSMARRVERTEVKELTTMNMRKYMSNVRDVDLDDVLGMMGLQKRSSTDWIFPMLAGVGAGMAIGAGLALFLTPYRGEEIRERVRRGASDAQKMLNERVGQISEKISEIKPSLSTGNTGSNVSTSRTVGVGSSGNRNY